MATPFSVFRLSKCPERRYYRTKLELGEKLTLSPPTRGHRCCGAPGLQQRPEKTDKSKSVNASQSTSNGGRSSRWMYWAGLLGCGALAGPVLAQADTPGPDARKLGVTESILDYCTKAYPSSADKIRYEIQLLTRGASPQALAKLRSSDEYRRARDAEDEFVKQVEPRNARRVCEKPPAAARPKQ